MFAKMVKTSQLQDQYDVEVPILFYMLVTAQKLRFQILSKHQGTHKTL